VAHPQPRAEERLEATQDAWFHKIGGRASLFKSFPAKIDGGDGVMMIRTPLLFGIRPMYHSTAMPPSENQTERPDPKYFDLGHQGDFDRTQIAVRLAMTPTQRLRRHEGWRLFVKECLERAALRRENRQRTG